jgi:uncharacterized secreted protein with C-terminal beta-propeller domain
MQDRAYINTNRVLNLSTLYAVDLSDPAHPSKAAQLSSGSVISSSVLTGPQYILTNSGLVLVQPTQTQTITPPSLYGYFSYLYPLDQNHLLGIGGGNATAGSSTPCLQITLLDITDLAHPVVVDHQSYNTPTTAFANNIGSEPRGFSYFPDAGIMALPYDFQLNGEMVHRLMLWHVDPNAGFAELGQVAQTSDVQRSFRIGDDLYSLADNDLKIVTFSDPAHVIADVSFS